MPLGKVPPELLQRHFNEIAAGGKGRTAEYLRAVLRSAFNRAKKAKRDLPMTETIYRALVRHTARRQQEAASTRGWEDSGYLFTSVTGAPRTHVNRTRESLSVLPGVFG